MQQHLNDLLEALLSNPGALTSIFRGLEKEGLRTTANGVIAATDHPVALGSALTHPGITTDYSEALLELITPVHADVDSLLQNLTELHQYVYAQLPESEFMWAGSMPCGLQGEESIRIAEYGDSNPGKLRHVYRIGLAHRYGRIMQSIAGLHFNFSLGDDFWRVWQQQTGKSGELTQVKTEGYFALIRNFRRWSWLLMYLFGASPVLDESFFDGSAHRLQELARKSYGLPYATSLRMSDLGYQNNAQSSLQICFNHLDTYIKTLFQAIHSPYPEYEQYGVYKDGEFQQLNTNLLQIENEYYNSIRPKRITHPGEKPLQALTRRGIEYIEVRCLDLNPMLPLGIDAEQIKFLDAFLLTCVLLDSPLVNDAECAAAEQNFTRTVEMGRSPDCRLLRAEQGQSRETTIAEYGSELLEKVSLVAQALDEENSGSAYSAAVAVMQERVRNPEQTPSAKVNVAIRENGRYLDWLKVVSQQHKAALLSNPLTDEKMELARLACEQSWQKEKDLRAQNQQSFDQFLHDYLNYS